MSANKALQKSKEAAPHRAVRPANSAAPPKMNAPQTSMLELQHDAGNRAAGALLRPSQEQEPVERSAEQLAGQALKGGAAGYPGTSKQPVDPQSSRGSIFVERGEALPGDIRQRFEERFGHDLSQVRVQRGPEAAQAADALEARAFTYGQEVAFNAGEYAPQTAAGEGLLAHELVHTLGPQRQGVALRQPKTAVKGKTGGSEQSKASLENVPAAARSNLRVITDPVAKSNIDVDDLFSTEGATTVIPLPDDAKVEYGTGVPQKVRAGLSSVAGKLITHTHDLKPNSTLTIALDLSKYGDEYASYRFSFYTQSAGKKQRQTILIEKLGKIGGDALPKDQAQAAQKKMEANGFSTRGSWKEAEKERLLAALSLAPDSLLAPISGIAFIRQAGDHPTDPSRGGQYNDTAHIITMYDRAFTVSLTRYGKPGSQANDEAVRAILHEIGHAADYKSLRAAWSKYETSKTKKERETGEAGLKNVVSPSGQVYQKEGKWEATEGSKNTDFRKAANKDSKIRLTEYSDKAWEEYFAEAFSLYLTAPETLKAVRPSVFAYFAKNYPTGK